MAAERSFNPFPAAAHPPCPGMTPPEFPLPLGLRAQAAAGASFIFISIFKMHFLYFYRDSGIKYLCFICRRAHLNISTLIPLCVLKYFDVNSSIKCIFRFLCARLNIFHINSSITCIFYRLCAYRNIFTLISVLNLFLYVFVCT